MSFLCIRNESSGINIVVQAIAPLLTAVIAVYNNASYAADLYRSIDAQTISAEMLDIILVNDGSTDNSLELAQAWQEVSLFDVTIIDTENAGVSAARNVGIEAARGEWLTFVDSDDVLHTDYFSAIQEFNRRDRFQKSSMMATRSIIFNEGTGIVVDNHPLGWKFKRGDRLVDINLEPQVVHLGGHSTVVRRDVVMANSLRFNDDVKPGFEDADFVGRYLGKFETPVMGLVSSARYYYRKRANGTSLIDTTWSKPEKFSHEPRFGHLGMLRAVTVDRGYTPVWAQNTVLYSLYWYFLADRSWNSPIAGVDQRLLDQFWNTLHEIFKYIDVSTIRNFGLRNYGWYLSEGILRQFKETSWVESEKRIVYRWGGVDQKTRSRRFVYSFVGERPGERFYINGTEVKALHKKTINNRSFGHVLMYERTITLPADGKLTICFDQIPCEIVDLPAFNRLPYFRQNVEPELQLAESVFVTSPQRVVRKRRDWDGSWVSWVCSGAGALHRRSVEEAWVNDKSIVESVTDIISRVVMRRVRRLTGQFGAHFDKKIVQRARTSQKFDQYADAWLFIDRPDRGDDNAEHLYRYVRDQHPEINAWFMIKNDARDWNRLQADGFRLLPYGSDASIPAVLRAKFVLSSHMDAGIFDLIDRKRFGGTPARRVFLQHGMNMNDISKWLNTKTLPLMITSARPELEALVADKTAYRISNREAKLTGLPRHDRLVALSEKSPKEGRRVILVAPTWRKYLSDELARAASALERQSILEGSQFYEEWSGVLCSESFKKIVEDNELQIVFALHDHLSEFADLFKFGDHVTVMPYREMSVQEVLASTRLLITDYSSLSTEAAIAGAAVIYYQFDADSIYRGLHSFKKDWFDYSDNGFGPVCLDRDEFENSIKSLESNAWNSYAVYEKRLRETLPYLDGSACSRVMEEIMALN